MRRSQCQKQRLQETMTAGRRDDTAVFSTTREERIISLIETSFKFI
jgi:hypothetical protein